MGKIFFRKCGNNIPNLGGAQLREFKNTSSKKQINSVELRAFLQYILHVFC